MTSYYSDGKNIWTDESLWLAAKNSPVETVSIYDLFEVEDIEKLVSDFRRIQNADLAFPVILTPEGDLADGYHRCAKRLLDGETTIEAKRIEVMPEGDRPHEDRWIFDPHALVLFSPGCKYRILIEEEGLVVQQGSETVMTVFLPGLTKKEPESGGGDMVAKDSSPNQANI